MLAPAMVRGGGSGLAETRGVHSGRKKKTVRKFQERRMKKGQHDDDGGVLVLCGVVVIFLAIIILPVWLSGSDLGPSAPKLGWKYGE